MGFPFTSAYPEPVLLDPGAFQDNGVTVAVSNHGTIKLQQHGKAIFLTPTEVAALAQLVNEGNIVHTTDVPWTDDEGEDG